MEPVVPAYRTPDRPINDWVADGAKGREPRVVKSLDLQPENLERHNQELQAKYATIAANEVRWAGEFLDDAEIVIVAYGTAARVARTAIQRAREGGLKAGLLRPITLWPFPSEVLHELAGRVRGILVVELSAGQMVEDVRLAVEGVTPVAFHGRMGGMVPSPGDVLTELRKLWAVTEPLETRGHRHHGRERRADVAPVATAVSQPPAQAPRRRRRHEILGELVEIDIADTLTEVFR